jgi:hypothetical protein
MLVSFARTSAHAVCQSRSTVLDLVQPRLAGRRLRRFGGEAGRDETEGQGIMSSVIEGWCGALGSAWYARRDDDGFRVIARKDGDRVQLYSRPGNDVTWP